MGSMFDITDRKRADEELRESESRFRTLSENALDIIYTLDQTGAFTYANPSWKRILGHDEEELQDLFHEFAGKKTGERTGSCSKTSGCKTKTSQSIGAC